MAYLKLLIATLSLATSWVIVVLSVVLLVHIGWHTLYITDYIPNLGSPPDFKPWLTYTMLSALPVVSLLYTYYFLQPTRVALGISFAGFPIRKLERKHSINQLVRDISRKMNIRLPKVYLVGIPTPNAFAISSFWSSAIGITPALLDIVDDQELAWILAHELGHIKSGDTWVSSFWLSCYNATNLAWIIRTKLTEALITPFTVSGAWVFVTYIITLPLLLLNVLSKYLEAISRFIFLLFDKRISRSMEYRCDRIATNTVGLSPGISVLSKLDHGGTSGVFNKIFSSHPSNNARIKHISMSNATN